MTATPRDPESCPQDLAWLFHPQHSDSLLLNTAAPSPAHAYTQHAHTAHTQHTHTQHTWHMHTAHAHTHAHSMHTYSTYMQHMHTAHACTACTAHAHKAQTQLQSGSVTGTKVVPRVSLEEPNGNLASEDVN